MVAKLVKGKFKLGLRLGFGGFVFALFWVLVSILTYDFSSEFFKRISFFCALSGIIFGAVGIVVSLVSTPGAWKSAISENKLKKPWK